MFLKAVFITLLLGNLAAAWPFVSPTMPEQAVRPVDSKSLKLVSQYKRNKFQEISSDGNLLLFYESSKFVRTYTLQANGKVIANQPNTNTDVLRVVERASGRELGRMRVGFFPQDVQLIPGTHRVFYKEPKLVDGKLEWRIKIWDLANGEARECSNANAASQSFSLIDAQHVLNIRRQAGKGERFAILTLPNCSQTKFSSIEHSDPMAGSISFTPARKEMAYVSGQKVIVRNTATLDVTKEINPATGMSFGENAIYTLDGKFLVVLATNTIFDKPDTKRFLYFYDTANYQLARQLDVTSWRPPVANDEVALKSNVIGTAVAMAPDGRTMAVAYTKDQSGTQQAQVVLYDLEKGREVGRAAHPAVKENRDDPFAAQIGKLAFTPQSKFLLSSTNDTLVWEVPSK
jgi:hypothetical protein